MADRFPAGTFTPRPQPASLPRMGTSAWRQGTQGQREGLLVEEGEGPVAAGREDVRRAIAVHVDDDRDRAVEAG